MVTNNWMPSIWTSLTSLLRRFLTLKDRSKHQKWDVEQIKNEEALARFICSKSQFSPGKGIVKEQAFHPKNGQTSVFRKTKMTGDEYIAMKAVVSENRGQDVKAAALIVSNKVFEAGLEVNPEESEHRWHANIEGWPEEKHKMKSRAQQLAESATLEL